MRKKLMQVLLFSAAIVVTALYHARPALATPGQGFSSTTLAQGRFGEIGVFNQFVSPSPKTLWLSLEKTKGLSDGSVLSTHPGHTLVIVTAGAVTQYQGDDPSCTPHVYTTGMAFVDEGGDHVHVVRNEGTVVAQVIAVRIIPAGQPGRIDVPDPGNCHF